MRFTSVCTIAAMLPTSSDSDGERPDRAASRRCRARTSRRRRAAARRTRRPSSPTAMNAVTGVGEPWYTSGVHMWNGAAATLKPRPTSRNAMPSSSTPSCEQRGRREEVGDAGEVRRAGAAVDERDAVEEHRRRERAEQEVLEPGLLRRRAGAGRTRRARTARSTGSRATRNTVTRSLADAISIMPVAEHSISAKYSGAFEVLALQVARRQQQREQRREQHDVLDEHGEAVDRDHAASSRLVADRCPGTKVHWTPVNTRRGERRRRSR